MVSEYEKDIEALVRKHSEQPTGNIIFYGSSSIRLWPSLKREFPEVTIENWGFGGATLWECDLFFERAIVPRQPRGIVFYGGDNDLAKGRTPTQVWEALRDMLDKRDAHLPGVPFAFGALKNAPSRAELVEQVEQTNEWCQRELASRENCEWLDWYDAMLDEKGEPRGELYLSDQLHLSRKGYDLWNSVLKRDLHWLTS
ncbi:GDSL family lipase [bacterium]|nr:MAG: GDSL family lipase [bacterium]